MKVIFLIIAFITTVSATEIEAKKVKVDEEVNYNSKNGAIQCKVNAVFDVNIDELKGVLESVESKEKEVDEKANSSIGFGYSDISGLGIAYRSYYDDSYMQYTALAIFDDQLYAFAGISRGEYFYKRYFRESSFSIPFALKYHYGVCASDSFKKSVTGGLGIGMELGNPLIKGYIFEFNIDYVTGYEDYTDDNEKGKAVLRPSVSASVNFNF